LFSPTPPEGRGCFLVVPNLSVFCFFYFLSKNKHPFFFPFYSPPAGPHPWVGWGFFGGTHWNTWVSRPPAFGWGIFFLHFVVEGPQVSFFPFSFWKQPIFFCFSPPLWLSINPRPTHLPNPHPVPPPPRHHIFFFLGCFCWGLVFPRPPQQKPPRGCGGFVATPPSTCFVLVFLWVFFFFPFFVGGVFPGNFFSHPLF